MRPRSELKQLTLDVNAIKIDIAQHKAQDDAMHQQLGDVKEALVETNQHLRHFGEKLSEYNQQLAVHIAGVQEARRHNELLEKQLEAFRTDADKRFEKLEAPHKWIILTYHGLKMFSYVTGAAAAIYGVIRFLKG